jgi:hypothetical protein
MNASSQEEGRRKLKKDLEDTLRAPLTPAMLALLAELNEAEREERRAQRRR